MKLCVFFVVLFVAAWIGVEGYAPGEKCIEECKEDHAPICCVYANGEAVMFGNACEAEKLNCNEGKKCVEETKGPCHHHGYGHHD